MQRILVGIELPAPKQDSATGWATHIPMTSVSPWNCPEGSAINDF